MSKEKNKEKEAEKKEAVEEDEYEGLTESQIAHIERMKKAEE